MTYPVVKLDVSAKVAITQDEISAGFRGKLDKYSAKLEGALNHGGKLNGDYKASLAVSWILFQIYTRNYSHV